MNATKPAPTLGQRALLYFSSPWRRAIGVVVALGAYVAAAYLGSLAGEHSLLRFVPLWLVYLAILGLTVLYTHGAVLRRPVLLPLEAMRRTAEKRFVHEESWDSSATMQETIAILQDRFSGTGVTTKVIGGTVWVEMGKDWRACQWRHKDAARHLKIRPTAHFFMEAPQAVDAPGIPAEPGPGTNPACRVTAYFQDRRLVGMWDVMQLSDEMTQAAVEIARESTGGAGAEEGQ